MSYLLSELHGQVLQVNAIIPQISYQFKKDFRLILVHIL